MPDQAGGWLAYQLERPGGPPGGAQVSGLELRDMRRITAENPQQASYAWGTAELIDWTSIDGIPLQGIL
jgi:hypothetical protein